MQSPEKGNSAKAEPEYKTFQKKRHEAWNTDPKVVEELAKKATGDETSRPERIVNGETNEVYSLSTESEGEVIVRLHHGENNRFEKERWAIERVAEKGVEVPRVLLVEEIEVDGKPLFVCVESKLSGASLEEAAGEGSAREDERLQGFLRQVGKELAKVHSVKTDGFGNLDKNGHGRFGSVPELVTKDKFIAPDKLLPALRDNLESQAIVLRGYEILTAEAETYKDVESRLIHNDLAPQHILVRESKAPAFIDFESAVGADPMQEFALWEYKFGKKFPLEFMIEGYTDKEMFSGDFKKRLNFWKIYRCFTSLRYCIRENKPRGIERALKAIAEASESFGK